MSRSEGDEMISDIAARGKWKVICVNNCQDFQRMIVTYSS
jgi:hypothetical protein